MSEIVIEAVDYIVEFGADEGEYEIVIQTADAGPRGEKGDKGDRGEVGLSGELIKPPRISGGFF